MTADTRIATRHRIEYTRNALRDVVLDHILDEQRRQNNTHRGVDQVEELRTLDGEPIDQSRANEVQQYLEDVCAQTCRQTHHNSQHHHQLTVGQAVSQPQIVVIDLIVASSRHSLQIVLFRPKNYIL